MLRKSAISIFAITVLTLSIATPVFAEDNSGNNGGFIHNIQNFFSRMFERRNSTNSEDQSEVRGKSSDDNEATGSNEIEKDRLYGQVRAGKITDAQRLVILAEVQKIRDEINSWATSNGISSSYVYRGLVGAEMMGGGDEGWKTATPSTKPRLNTERNERR